MVELFLGLIMIYTPIGVYAYNLPLVTPELPRTATSTPLTIQDKIVKELGVDFLPIVKCESNFHQFKDGKPLMSPTHDVGIMQINNIHWQRAKNLGLDIFNSVDDNIAMAKIIYKEQGKEAWMCYKG